MKIVILSRKKSPGDFCLNSTTHEYKLYAQLNATKNAKKIKVLHTKKILKNLNNTEKVKILSVISLDLLYKMLFLKFAKLNYN